MLGNMKVADVAGAAEVDVINLFFPLSTTLTKTKLECLFSENIFSLVAERGVAMLLT
jgi:hypothetical protein